MVEIGVGPVLVDMVGLFDVVTDVLLPVDVDDKDTDDDEDDDKKVVVEDVLAEVEEVEVVLVVVVVVTLPATMVRVGLCALLIVKYNLWVP